MSTIPQNGELLKNLIQLLAAHRKLYKQERIYLRVVALVFAELFVFARHTVTQMLWTLGLNEADWSAWYRIFSSGRFDADKSSAVLVAETLKHVRENDIYVVAGDGTQTPRSSRKMEGVGWLRNMRTPPFKMGIHLAQRWFNGSWLMPAQNGYSRALPLRWLPAFTTQANHQSCASCKEWEAALQFVHWLLRQFAHLGRGSQPVLLVADGSYDTVDLWKQLPEGVILLVRSAKNRVLHHLLPPAAHGNRRYGERAATPQTIWQQREGWRKARLTIRGQQRDLQYRVEGPFLRKGSPNRPLFLLVIRGQRYLKHGHSKHRDPVPYLVNAIANSKGGWQLPFTAQTLIFWAWQRWEVEVCHRELKSNFGLGNKQCWNPQAALVSVQWSAWVYSLLLLAGYRTWGLCAAPSVPTRWWRGSGRWSLNTLWRAFRAELWGQPDFRPLWSLIHGDWFEKEACLHALFHAAFASARS